MSWRDAATMALRNIGRRLGRATLTVLAVALAAALLSALLVVAGAARTRVLDQLSKGGPLTGIQVVAAEPDPGQPDSDNPRPGRARVLDQAAAHEIARVPGVKSLVPVVSTPVFVLPSRPRASTPRARRLPAEMEPFRDTMSGADLRRAAELPLSVSTGRLPQPGSGTEVAVTEGYLRHLGLRLADASAVVGTELELGSPRVFPGFGDRQVRGRWTRAIVVGVVAQQAAPGNIVAPIGQVQTARDWTSAGAGSDVFLDPSPYSGLFVVADGLDRIGAVRSAITRIGYSTSAPENLIASVQRYLHVVEIVLTGIGLVALLIAALGIANALLAAVRERRRDIGVLKALGARDRDVRRVYLIEAAVLGLAGGVIGTIAGFAIARGLGTVVNGYLTAQGLRGVDVGLPVAIAVGGVLGSALLALVAGVVPAQRAARLPARQAMGEL